VTNQKMDLKKPTGPVIYPKVRNRFSPRVRVSVRNDEPSMTKQSYKDSCDVNKILARYQKTGVIDHVKAHGGDYGFMDGSTYQEQMLQITKAQSMFNELPSKARAYFENDPAKFLDTVENFNEDGSTAALLDELGLTHPNYVSPVNPPKSLTEAQAPSEPPAPAEGD